MLIYLDIETTGHLHQLFVNLHRSDFKENVVQKNVCHLGLETSGFSALIPLICFAPVCAILLVYYENKL